MASEVFAAQRRRRSDAQRASSWREDSCSLCSTTVLGAVFGFGSFLVAYIVAWILVPEA